MQTRAAILWEPRTDWSIEDIELDDPKAGEVKVRLAAAGLCHSDEHLRTGDMVLDPEIAQLMGWEQFPIIGGHEGAGEVVEVGPGVTTLQEGDHVVLSFVPACGRCPSCAMGRQHLCDLGAFLLGGRQIGDMTARHHAKSGRDLGIMCLLGTFAPYTVVSEASCVKIDDGIPLDKAALVGCGVTTGWGAAVNAADVQPGETVVVIGLGGIGMNAVQGAAMAGARHVIAVDPVEWKRDRAGVFGATHTAASVEEAAAMIAEMTWGANADKAILTTGVATGDLIGPMMGMVAKGGRGVVTAVAPISQENVQLNLFDLAMQRKELVGCIFGNANPRRDIPRLLRLYEEGRLKLDELVTNTYALDEVNQGYQDMLEGKNIRGMIKY
ncbi:NDMA-dependent alcohol dehydrogenase [Thermomonospora cellulosilytica]|uniref:S-(Hydroxymethyl)glutathione dehydrogenase/alcohol dehydrogenase n=1 Tax=Thermomonospora cellulosilytica TaxID=1411118 RepID=A0A7W3RAZ3_9ACTN|nr:NDMA-dependent alcohol dehydrogenase [Thermomonospora cellulosilytica]MBA9006331.1 S-(hydroxymethyl)glutathione dehydrogenase/alcohol dehydrogenase [Thermomonospora cellulosilytica]